jgi:RHS repeat-associated protein
LHDSVNEIDDDDNHANTPASTITAASGQRDWPDPTYDGGGNMTSAPGHHDAYDLPLLKYDAWNRLVRVDIGPVNPYATFEYDGLGQRIVQVNNGIPNDGTFDYYYNDQWQLLTEVKDSSVEAIYHWHPHYVDALGVRMRASDTHFFLQDANFNVTAAVKDDGNAVVERYGYTPYGEPTILDADFTADSVNDDGYSDIDNRHLYTGREFDWDSGLQLNRQRYYASHLGRWLTRDPIEYRGGLNLYAYVIARPTFYIDPAGLFPRPFDAIGRPIWRTKPLGWPTPEGPFDDPFSPQPPEWPPTVNVEGPSYGTPRPYRWGLNINIWGEGEAPGFHDFAAAGPSLKEFKDYINVQGQRIERPSTGKLENYSVSVITLRNSPVTRETLDEMLRICRTNCTITITVGCGTIARDHQVAQDALERNRCNDAKIQQPEQFAGPSGIPACTFSILPGTCCGTSTN